MFAWLDESTGFLTFAAATTIFSLGMSPVFTLTTDIIVGSAPPERAGAASAISETSAEMGGALGIALFGSIGVAVYRAALGDAPPEAAATLAGAMTAAERLPAPAAAELVAAARRAFLDGVRLCAAISAAASLGLSALAGLALRRQP
jgi:DHA2 family multidrug resistance protein-like MFS transporter